MITLTLSPEELSYLSCLVDIDDDPTNAVDFGFSVGVWLSARAAVFNASKEANA